jgi:hypothetical protein
MQDQTALVSDFFAIPTSTPKQTSIPTSTPKQTSTPKPQETTQDTIRSVIRTSQKQRYKPIYSSESENEDKELQISPGIIQSQEPSAGGGFAIMEDQTPTSTTAPIIQPPIIQPPIIQPPIKQSRKVVSITLNPPEPSLPAPKPRGRRPKTNKA